MLKRFAKLSMPLLALAGFAFVATPKANATLELRAVEVGTATTLDVIDNGAGDTNPAVGVIALGSTTVPITFGDFSVLGSVSTSNATVGSGAVSSLKSNALTVTNNSSTAHQIDLQISDTGFTFPPSPLFLTATASGGFSVVNGTGNTSVAGSNVHALAWADATNTLFGKPVATKVQDFTQTAFTGLNSGYNNSQSLNGFTYNPATGYSMTVELIFTVAGNSELDNRGNVIQGVSTVPEPTTMASLGLGLVAAIGFARRRRTV